MAAIGHASASGGDLGPYGRWDAPQRLSNRLVTGPLGNRDQSSSSSKKPGWCSSPDGASPCGRSSDLTWALRTKRLFPSLMLWSWPSRAQRPIVPGVNLTFEDASSSAASEREIQSTDDFDIAQSGSFDGAGAAAAVGPAAESEPEAGPEPEASPEDDPASLELA